MDAYGDRCRATSISTAHPTRTFRRSFSRPTSRPVNASRSRRHSKPYLPSLEKTLKSASPNRVALLGDGVMLGTAWIDRPVDTQGRAPCFHVLLSAAWKHGHAQANDRHSSRVFAMPPRGFARTTGNGCHGRGRVAP